MWKEEPRKRSLLPYLVLESLRANVKNDRYMLHNIGSLVTIV